MALQFVTRQLADSIITTAKLAADSVTAEKLANGAVDTAAVLDANITTAKLAANAVTAAKADLTGTWDYSSATLKAGTPLVGGDVANKLYVDNVAQGIKWKSPARVVATSNIDIATGLDNGSVIDGVTVATTNRVLLVGQTNATENGLYTVAASGAASRAFDLNTGSAFPSAAIFVSEGTANADTGWVCTNDTSPTIGSTNITFVQFTGLGAVIAGAGLTKTGNTLDVAVGNGVQISSDAVAVKLAATNPGLSFDGSGGLQQVLASNSGLELTATGLKIDLLDNSLQLQSNGINVRVKANGGILSDATGLSVSTANGVQVDGGGFVSLKLNGGTLSADGSGVKVADGGVGTTQLAADSVTLAKAAFRPYAQSFTGGTALAYDLSQDIRSEFYPGVLVAFNGQLLAKVASSPGEGEFVVDRNVGTSKTRITLGGTAPSVGDTITANYLG